MSFFKRLKKDIGIEEKSEEKEREQKEEKPQKKRGRPSREPKKKIVEEEIPKEAFREEIKKIPISTPKKSPSDWLKTEGQLAVDVYQTDTEFCVQAPIAGIKPENIDISIENDMLVITGERKETEEIREKNYFYQECYWGSFSRKIILPEDIDAQRIKAILRNGILIVRIPRIRRIKKKKVAVHAE